MGRYALASMPCVVNGLHAVRFMVIEPTSGVVLSIAAEKVNAMGAARDVIRATELLAKEDEAQTALLQTELWPRDEADEPKRPRPVSRRRRDIFAKSHGCCHYCSTPLTLDGSWHVEHMLPRALGGADEASNLVAACVPCNLSKSDRTAVEFVMQETATSTRPSTTDTRSPTTSTGGRRSLLARGEKPWAQNETSSDSSRPNNGGS